MRSLAAIAMLALAGCATAPPLEGASGICDAAGIERFIGQAATSETGAAILATTHASILRWVTPGMMITMEFSASRVTVRLGPDGKIAAVTCG